MYPRISHLIYDLTGLQLPIPIQTFGTFMALAFLTAYLLLRKELKRREDAGHFALRTEKVRKSGPMPIWELVVVTLAFSFVGWKLGLLITDRQYFYDHTQEIIFSTDGSVLFAIIGLVGGGAYKVWRFIQRKNAPIVEEEITVGPAYYIGAMTTLAFVYGILGSKVFAWFEDWQGFLADPLGSLLSFDGLTFFGGLLAAGFMICRFLWKRGFHVLTSIDAFVPALILAYGIGRIGCQMAGDGDWGIVNEAPQPAALAWLPDWTWSYQYPHNVISTAPSPNLTLIESDCASSYYAPYCYQLAKPVFPTPIYETIMCVAIFIVLMLVRKRMRFAGELTALYLILLGMERFWIEKIRVNTEYTLAGLHFTQAELIAALMILSGAVLWIIMRRKGRRMPEYGGARQQPQQNPV
jgi:prolipoprotein diacylglyceryltransferase